MNRSMITAYILLLFSSISACNVFGDKGSDVKKIPAFDWQKVHRFATESISFIHITHEDELFVGTENRWYQSNDFGDTFMTKSSPDSVIFEIVKKFGDQYFAIGEYDTEVPLFGDSSNTITVRSDGIFSSDNGSDWEQLLGPFWMYDILLDDTQNLYIAKYLGVSILHIPTMEEKINEFIPSTSLEFVNVLSQNNYGEIFAGSDRGLYRSNDKGETWERLISASGSSFDDIEQVEVIDNKIIAISKEELFLSTDDGETWDIKPLIVYSAKSNYTYEYYFRDIEFTPAGELYASTYLGVGIARPDSLSKIHIAGPADYDLENSFDYSKLKVFSNGNVVVGSGSYIMIGTRNNESGFWD